MKTLLFLIALTFSLSVHAQSAEAGEPLTGRLVAMLTSLDSSYSTGALEGSRNYGAQLECSNSEGDLNLETMKCFVRSLAGFSVTQQSPVQISGLLASDLKEFLLSHSMTYMITNGVSGIGSTISCTDNSGVVTGGEPPRNRCKIGRLF